MLLGNTSITERVALALDSGPNNGKRWMDEMMDGWDVLGERQDRQTRRLLRLFTALFFLFFLSFRIYPPHASPLICLCFLFTKEVMFSNRSEKERKKHGHFGCFGRVVGGTAASVWRNMSTGWGGAQCTYISMHALSLEAVVCEISLRKRVTTPLLVFDWRKLVIRNLGGETIFLTVGGWWMQVGNWVWLSVRCICRYTFASSWKGRAEVVASSLKFLKPFSSDGTGWEAVA